MTRSPRVPERLETERLVLRRFAFADVLPYVAIRAKPQVMRYMPGGEERAKEAATFAPRTLDSFAANWRDDGLGPWAVEEKAGGRLLGHLGLRALQDRGEIELLYMLDETAWGNGFAREGARAALAAADAAGLGALVGFTHPDNVRSQGVLRASGFAPTGPVAVFGLDALGFLRSAPD